MAKDDDDEKEDGKKKKRVKTDWSNIAITGSTFLQQKKVLIPVSPELDIMFGGGLPEGVFGVFSGPPKTGKTTTALDFAATATSPIYKCDLSDRERHVHYYKTEGRLERHNLKGIHHLREETIHIIQSEVGRILKAEDFLEIAEERLHKFPGDVHIMDSFSSLCSNAEYESDYYDRFRPDLPLLLARFLRRICNVVPINKSIFIGITHIIANQGAKPGQSPWSEASGQKIKYANDFKAKITYKKYIEGEEGAAAIGQNCFWDCETSPIGPPNAKATSVLRYNYGLDKPLELLRLCGQLGSAMPDGIKKSGNWFKFPGVDKQINGELNARELLESNPELYKRLYLAVRSFAGLPECEL